VKRIAANIVALLGVVALLGCGQSSIDSPTIEISAGVSLVRQPTLIFGGYGEGDGQIQHIQELAVDGTGRVFIADNIASRVVVFTADGEYDQTFSYSGDSANALAPGFGVHPILGMVAEGDDLYFADWTRIFKRSASGEVTQFPTDSLKGRIFALGIDSDGRAYVAAGREKIVQRFTEDGGYETWPYVTEGGRARSITVGPDGHVYIGLRDDARTLRFTPTGEFVGSIGEAEVTLTDDDIDGLAVDWDDNLYVGDEDGAQYVVFNTEGKRVAAFGEAGSEKNQHLRGFDFVVDTPRKRLVVGDRGNFRVQIYPLDGVSAPLVDKTNTVNPWGATTTPDHVVLHLNDNPSGSIQFVWRTMTEVNRSLAQINEGDTFDPSKARDVMGQTSPEMFNSNTGPYHIHGVRVDELSPDTKYAYRVGDGKNWSESASFTTQPAGDDQTIKAVVLGDSRNRYDVWKQIVGLSAKESPRFIVSTGDLVSSGWNQLHWDQYFDNASIEFASIAFMPSMGNHEWPFHNYLAQFILPENGPEGFKEYAYSFDVGPTHWVALSSEHDLAAQVQWLKDDMSASDKPWKFVFFHKPLYSAKESRAEERRRFVAEWGPAIDSLKIDIAWAGHDHYYSRSHPMRGDEIVGSPSEGTVYITTGGAGAPLYDLQMNDYMAVAEKIEHYCLLTVSPTKLDLVVKLADKSVLDRFSITK
jgi:hypothetical protein